MATYTNTAGTRMSEELPGPLFGWDTAAFHENFMVPALIRPYCSDVIEVLRATQPGDVLEIGAGTGTLSREIAGMGVSGLRSITATDVSDAMLYVGQESASASYIRWGQADAHNLPFDDGSYDTVLCQFAAMFFSDKVRAFCEAHRVMRHGGQIIVLVWDRLRTNDFSFTVDEALRDLFSDNPPSYLSKLAHGYSDIEVIVSDLRSAGFIVAPRARTISHVSECEDASNGAHAYTHGSPLRDEVVHRGDPLLIHATSVVEIALTVAFGVGRIVGNSRAHLILGVKP
jgi:ubiquinone/menaquinone biosynthesis C-methylase UbiE